MLSKEHLKVLETERLVLTRLSIEDAEFIFRLLNEPSWKKFIGDKNILTLRDAEDYILNVPTKMYEKHGFSLFLVSLKQNGSCIGLCGLIKRDDLEDVDLGFAFLSEYCGAGYAQESSLAVIDYAKTKHQLGRLAAITSSGNIQSKKLLERLGFQYKKIVQLKANNDEVELYEKLLNR